MCSVPILFSLDLSSTFRGKSSPSALGTATTSSAASGEDADDIEERRRLLRKFLLRITRRMTTGKAPRNVRSHPYAAALTAPEVEHS
jgi:hypothetical protein